MAKRKPTATKGKRTTAITTTRHGRPRSAPLPGMEDSRILPLDEVGAEYAEIRDSRIELTQREHALKVTARVLMKKYGKTIYRTDEIEIRVVPAEDDIKVKILKPDEDGDTIDLAPLDAKSRAAGERRQAIDAMTGEDLGK